MKTQIPPRGLGHTGFTLVELLMVVAIIALLGSLLLPVIQKAKIHAHHAVCSSNLRELGMQSMMYASNEEGWLLMSQNVHDGLAWPHLLERDYL